MLVDAAKQGWNRGNGICKDGSKDGMEEMEYAYCNTPPQLEQQSDQAEYQIMRLEISIILIRLMKL